MGKTLHIAVSIILIALLSACANSEEKWSKNTSATVNDASMDNNSSWQKEQKSEDSPQKATSSSWKDEYRY